MNQLGFDSLLATAQQANAERELERETAHLPSTMAEALPFYRGLIETHHAAMLAAAGDEVLHIRDEARKLALRLNRGEPGILAGDDAPGCILERDTAAASGTVPLWGQAGDFTVTAGTMRVRIELDGMFGIGGRYLLWPGFSAHAVDYGRPFLSETGYRSFIGIHAPFVPGMTPDAFAREIIAAHVARELKGRLLAIEREYRPDPAA